MRLLGLLVERLNTFGWLVSTECYGLPVSGLCVGLGRMKLGHLFGYFPILYQFTHSRSFVITLKSIVVNDEWQVLTAIILMLTCQCHEIVNQKSQFIAWIEAGTSRNRTHSNIVSIISDENFHVILCELLWASGWKFEHWEPSLFHFFCGITPSTSLSTLSSCSKFIWCYCRGKFG